MPSLQFLRPMLTVSSVPDAISFYENVLGFRCTGTWGEDPAKPTWCELQRDAVRIMFTQSMPHTHDDGEVHTDEPSLGGSLYINVDDVDELFAQLKGKVQDFAWEPQDFPHGMREFGLHDCNGFVLVFGQSVRAPAQ